MTKLLSEIRAGDVFTLPSGATVTAASDAELVVSAPVYRIKIEDKTPVDSVEGFEGDTVQMADEWPGEI